VAVDQQPIYFKPQQMQLSGQQQYQPYQPNFQPSYVPQQIQPQMQLVSASTAQQSAQMQQAAPIPVPHQQQTSGKETDVAGE
jgi:hypothetical protein